MTLSSEQAASGPGGSAGAQAGWKGAVTRAAIRLPDPASPNGRGQLPDNEFAAAAVLPHKIRSWSVTCRPHS